VKEAKKLHKKSVVRKFRKRSNRSIRVCKANRKINFIIEFKSEFAKMREFDSSANEGQVRP
jgi:hypothetical protein